MEALGNVIGEEPSEPTGSTDLSKQIVGFGEELG